MILTCINIDCGNALVDINSELALVNENCYVCRNCGDALVEMSNIDGV